jgi:hypothetical protein
MPQVFIASDTLLVPDGTGPILNAGQFEWAGWGSDRMSRFRRRLRLDTYGHYQARGCNMTVARAASGPEIWCSRGGRAESGMRETFVPDGHVQELDEGVATTLKILRSNRLSVNASEPLRGRRFRHVVKVLDFGLAKLIDVKRQTSAGNGDTTSSERALQDRIAS